MRIVLLRHFEVDAEPDLCLGQLDVALSKLGQAQAVVFAESLDWEPDALICSDLLRTRQSAAPIAQRFGLVPTLAAGLRELDMGRFTGYRWSQIHAEQTQALARWGANFVDQAPPGGESFNQLRQRAVGAFNHALCLGKRVLMIAHAGSIRALLAAANNWTPAESMRIPVAYGQSFELNGQPLNKIS